MASILSTFKLVNVTKETKPHDPMAARRDKFIDGLKEQLAILEADTQGKPFRAMREVYEKVPQADGTTQRVKVERDKRIRRFWFEKDGQFYVEVRFGTRPVYLQKGQFIIQAGEGLLNVRNTLEALIKATEGGELDKPLAAIQIGKKAS